MFTFTLCFAYHTNSAIRRGGEYILIQTINGILIPLWGTVAGAALVLFVRKQTGAGLQTAISGFSSGVMIAASIWSLIIPSIELSEQRNVNPALPVTLGFALGILFFLACDAILERRRKKIAENGGKPVSRVFMSCFAIALHNLPEGMAVGAVFAQVLADGSADHFTAALVLSIGIAVQNFPEGAIISLPLYADGAKKWKAFAIGALSGVVEPLGAFITILAAGVAVPLLPYLLGFAAGAMIYAVLDGKADLGNQKANYVSSFSAGFLLMMCLDVLLG